MTDSIQMPILLPLSLLIEKIESVTIGGERYVRTVYTDFGCDLVKRGYVVDPGYTNDNGVECCMIDVL